MSVGTTTREAVRPRSAVSVIDRFGAGLQRLPLHIVIIIFCAIWVVPTVGMIINSFRSVSDMGVAGWWTTLFPPHGFTFASYQQVLAIEGVAPSIVSSVLITIPATVIQLTIATMGAYAFAWMKFPGKNLFFIVIVGLMVVPIQMTLIPVLQFFKLVHLNATIIAVWLAHSGYGLPFEVFLLRNYLGGLPREVFESAEVDGAGHSVRFLRIAVPMTDVPGYQPVPALHSRHHRASDIVRRRVAVPHRRGRPPDGASTGGLHRPPALLRARRHGGFGQGVGAPASKAAADEHCSRRGAHDDA